MAYRATLLRRTPYIKYPFKQLPTRLAVSCCLLGSLSSTVLASELPAEASTDTDNQLFQSRFRVNQFNQVDLSVFDSCPSQSSKKTPLTNDSKISEKLSTQDNPRDSDNIKLNADSVPENSEETTRLEGNVTMASAESLLKADQLVSDHIKQRITANGNVSVETKDSLLRADKFEGEQQSGTSKLTDVDFHFFVNNANGEAESISFDENNVATLNDLTFSTCPTNDESWRFSADELQLDQESGWGEAWGMWLKVKGIPVFYFPYLNFPINAQRKSGILMPAVSESGRNGLDIGLPIYWNITEQADATFRPRSIQNRGNQLGTEFRYLTTNSMNKLSFEILQGDRLSADLLALAPELGEGLYGLNEDRWAVSLTNQTQFSEHWSASIDASKVSDRDYFRDLGAVLISPEDSNGQSHLLSKADISYQDDIWLVSLMAESTQSLVGDEPYRLLPSLAADADYYQISSGLHWQLETDFTRFDHADQAQTIGTRWNIRPSLSYPLRNAFAWLTPKYSYQATRYSQDSAQMTNRVEISRNLPIFSLDTGFFFDRTIQWDEQSVTHSLEPRLFYAYIPHREQSIINNFDSRTPDFSFSQLWQANRFSGVDRIGDTNHVAMALTNRFISDKNGDQMLAFSVGRKFYFDDRRVQLVPAIATETGNSSPWLFDVSYRATKNLEFSGFIEWSDGDSTVDANSRTNLARSQIKFEPIQDHIVNLSHRVRNNNGFTNEELDLSFAWPINDEWRLVGRWYNDLQMKRTAESLFGFEYESCCWAVSIVSRRYLDVRLDAFGNPISGGSIAGQDDEFNSGIQLQFVFKGLGSPGQKSVSQLLKNSIRGYRTRY